MNTAQAFQNMPPAEPQQHIQQLCPAGSGCGPISCSQEAGSAIQPCGQRDQSLWILLCFLVLLQALLNESWFSSLPPSPSQDRTTPVVVVGGALVPSSSWHSFAHPPQPDLLFVNQWPQTRCRVEAALNARSSCLHSLNAGITEYATTSGLFGF